MELLFGVSNFGKIKHAEITLSNFTLFVGDNNSGKTFMMQLLYGVLIELGNMEPALEGIEEQGKKELFYGVDWLTNMETRVNDYLAENKEKIVRRIFHKDIEVGKLYFRFVSKNEIYVCEARQREFNKISGEEGDVVTKVPGVIACIYSLDMKDGSRRRMSNILFHYAPDRNALKEVVDG